MCVYYCMEILNRVGRSENVFILKKKKEKKKKKILYGDNWETIRPNRGIPKEYFKKTLGLAAKNRDGRKIVNRRIFIFALSKGYSYLGNGRCLRVCLHSVRGLEVKIWESIRKKK